MNFVEASSPHDPQGACRLDSGWLDSGRLDSGWPGLVPGESVALHHSLQTREGRAPAKLQVEL